MSRFFRSLLAGIAFVAFGSTPAMAKAAPQIVPAAFRTLHAPKLPATAHTSPARVDTTIRC